MKRKFVLILVLGLTHVPISCIEDECGEFTPSEATITELSSSVGTFTSSGFSSLISNDYDVAAVQITITDMEYSTLSELNSNRFSFVNSAYACSPPEPVPTQGIQSINITSEASVFSQGKEYLKGESLTELFKITGYGYSYSNNEKTVNEFIEAQTSDLWIFGYAGANVVFQLTDQPDSVINEKLTFVFEFTDSEKISVQTSNFEVMN
ncbi:MAG: hypothetical protein RIC03_04485 [Cyclobacteriaceae bacterium]